MKKKKFKQATSACGCVYVNHAKNTIIMKFKPSFWDKVKIVAGVPIWGGTPINRSRLIKNTRSLDISVKRTAFLKEEDD